MRRREFVVGAALTLGLARAHGQSSAPLPRLGWLLPVPNSGPQRNDPQPSNLLGRTFLDALAKLGWVEGKSVQIERRFVGDAADATATLEARAREIVALKPDVIFTGTTPAVDALRRETSTIPIVFTGVNDPLVAGFVSSLAHPGGNITGFANFEPSSFGKMIALLKEAVPRTRTIAFMYPKSIAGKIISGNMRDWMYPRATIDEAAKAHSVSFVDTPVGDEEQVELAFARLAEDQGTAALVETDGYLFQRRNSIVASAARHHVPTMYTFPAFASIGGLMAYGIDALEQQRQAAGYVDRILRGANPGDLPVQMSTKYEFVINMKAANALGINIPPALLSTADEVIE